MQDQRIFPKDTYLKYIIWFGTVRTRYATGFVIEPKTRVLLLLLLFIIEQGVLTCGVTLTYTYTSRTKEDYRGEMPLWGSSFSRIEPSECCPFSTGSLLMDISRHLLTVIVCGKGIVIEVRNNEATFAEKRLIDVIVVCTGFTWALQHCKG